MTRIVSARLVALALLAALAPAGPASAHGGALVTLHGDGRGWGVGWAG